MSSECVLCDWQIDWNSKPWAAYLPGSTFPLTWKGTEIQTVLLTDGIGESMPGVALVAHWARDHPEQLRSLVGEVELDHVPRWIPPVPS